MRRKVTEYTLPAYWASALINGDFSGLADDEAVRCAAVIRDARADGWEIVSIAQDESGEDQEPRFTRFYDLYDRGSPFTGGNILDYVAIARARVRS